MLRFLARSMLASYYIVDGVSTVRNPDRYTAELEPVANRLVPMVKQAAPESVANVIPSDPRTLSRVAGVAQIIGGASLATGIGRRFGAVLVAVSLLPKVIGASPLGTKRRTSSGEIDAEAEAERTSNFLAQLALFGAALLATGDTQGKPSLGWRAEHARQGVAKSADKRLASTSKKAKKKAKRAERKLASKAQDVRSSADKATKSARKAAKKAGKKVNAEVTAGLKQVPELKL